MGGLSVSQGEAVIVIDCDLQDPPALIPEMLRLWRSGYKVVIPQRRTREGEHVIKRMVAFSGYWLINKIATVPIPRNTGDFRLLDRRVVDELVKLNESHGFLRGLTSVVGFKTHLLPFDRNARVAGSGKYNRLTGSLRIGFNGIVAFSDYLLNMMVTAGFALAVLSMVLIVVVASLKYIGAYDFTAGVATVAILVLFLGGFSSPRWAFLARTSVASTTRANAGRSSSSTRPWASSPIRRRAHDPRGNRRSTG